MTKVIVDPTTLAQLRNARQMLELCDDAGHLVGHFVPARGLAAFPEGGPQISEEELDCREQAGGGRRLADILADLDRNR